MKKILMILITAMLLIGFTGCEKKRTCKVSMQVPINIEVENGRYETQEYLVSLVGTQAEINAQEDNLRSQIEFQNELNENANIKLKSSVYCF